MEKTTIEARERAIRVLLKTANSISDDCGETEHEDGHGGTDMGPFVRGADGALVLCKICLLKTAVEAMKAVL